MTDFKQIYPSLKNPSTGLFSAVHRKYFIGFCVFWIFIAFLEFGQDYISSVVNENAFMVGESISYKLFWPLFIPFFLLLDYGITKMDMLTSRPIKGIDIIIQVITVTVLHLLVFSLILFGLSVLIQDDPMTLMIVLFEKLSTRLYIALSVYSVLSALTVFIRHRRIQAANSEVRPANITVKNGKNTALVPFGEINCIKSDGPYLDIHTGNQKYVILGTLKKMNKNLPGNFKRIHKSTIVNIDKVKKLKSRGNGDYDLIMDDKQELRLSRNYRKNLEGSLL